MAMHTILSLKMPRALSPLSIYVFKVLGIGTVTSVPLPSCEFTVSIQLLLKEIFTFSL